MICEHFNASLIARDCKPKTITKEWRSSARLMIDADGHTLEQVLKCIDWVTAHSFWRRNVLSVPKLREKYERLRLEADEERKGKKISNRFHNQDATGARVDDNPFRKSA